MPPAGRFGLSAPTPRLAGAPEAAVVAVGACDLRAAPDHRAEMVSQALHGERLRLDGTDADGRWVRARGDDGYAGWVRCWGLATGSAAAAADWVAAADRVVRRPWLWRRDGGGPLPFGSRVARTADPGGTPGIEGPLGPLALGRADQRGLAALAAPAAPQRPVRPAALLATARGLRGTPYLWGGRTPAGLDCSGFVQLVFAAHGIHLPRDARDQWRRLAGGDGRLAFRAAGRRKARRGDLWFFGPGDGDVTHVALSTGGAGLIHAYGQVQEGSLDPAAPSFEPELPGLCLGFVGAPLGGLQSS